MTELVDRIPLRKIDGFPVPLYGFKESSYRDIYAMVPREGDVFLTTYPKCGTTWAQYIIWGILHEGAIPPANLEVMMGKEIPFLELVGTKQIDDMPSPRIFKLHLPNRLTPQSPNAKYISVARNPFDACVSFYHHLNQIDAKIINLQIRFDTYFLDFVKGEGPFGCYFEHVISWYERRNDPNVLFLFFEDMKEDPKKAVLEIAKFLGEEHFKKLNESPDVLNAILKHTSFEYLKQHVDSNITVDPEIMAQLKNEHGIENIHHDKMEVIFFREGKVGGSKTVMSNEQWRILDQAIDDKVQDPELRKMMKKTKLK